MMDSSSPQHFDLWLLWELQQKGAEPLASHPLAGTCCIVPPLGSFQEHESRNIGGSRAGTGAKIGCVLEVSEIVQKVGLGS